MEAPAPSIHTGVTKVFGVVDFIVFGCTMGVSLLIGIFYAVKDRNKNDPSEFLVGGRNMGVLPVSLSLTVTFLSALTLLGMPAEIFNYNTMFWWLALAMVIAVAGSAHIFSPIFYNMGITSAYEYTELRFGKTMTVLASLNWALQTVSYLAFVLYAPSLALKSVTGMELWISIFTVGGLVTVYTAMGGMKAVLWTDSFQAVLIVVGLLAVLIQGSIIVGGFSHAWEIAYNNSRIHFHEFSPDPGTRHSFWSVVVGGGMMWMSYYAVNQCQIQRLLSCPSLRKVQIALWINAVGLASIVSLSCMIGVVLYAFYSDCHPLHYNNLISTTDELLPLFVMDVLGHLHGLPGIFLSCIFSGSLSSLSSGINALSAVALQDYIRPFCPCTISNLHATIISKLTAALFGLLVIGLAFVASELGDILQVSYTVLSTLDGPLFGTFVLGMFFPRANRWGALSGYLLSLVLMFWIGFGSYFNNVTTRVSGYSLQGCNWNVTNMTIPRKDMNTTAEPSEDYLSIYRLSYLYYTAAGAFVTVVIGITVSLVSGYGKPITTNPQLICPVIDILFPWVPEKVRRRFRYRSIKQEEPLEIELQQKQEPCQLSDAKYSSRQNTV